ncbi:hypothetical protein HLRTI_001520 [Halorhabdus tiamatea SARL4B]|uniref:Hypothetical membrane protein n=1 Tax=Halorhabdus tiamatea SARL4B TaxID=1033806 RepID=F7PFM2_9EURY|nr:hypothetical protein [Halorhabdus tiamatea]ERJ06441.1 hypothetical protein HLRTI_001520 [Halorhabdus tiamatea SARL4B]CCQ34319.1 hypothetical membrane protein [Halorhabdus tiamatea SARL4B]
MAFGKIDLNDAVVSPFFVLASGVSVGLFDLTLFGLDFADPLFRLGSGTTLDFSFAALVAILAVGIAYLTNGPELDNLGLVETWTVAITVLLVLGQPFVPLLDSILQSSPVVGLVALVIQAGGFYTLSYLG